MTPSIFWGSIAQSDTIDLWGSVAQDDGRRYGICDVGGFAVVLRTEAAEEVGLLSFTECGEFERQKQILRSPSPNLPQRALVLFGGPETFGGPLAQNDTIDFLGFRCSE